MYFSFIVHSVHILLLLLVKQASEHMLHWSIAKLEICTSHTLLELLYKQSLHIGLPQCEHVSTDKYVYHTDAVSQKNIASDVQLFTSKLLHRHYENFLYFTMWASEFAWCIEVRSIITKYKLEVQLSFNTSEAYTSGFMDGYKTPCQSCISTDWQVNTIFLLWLLLILVD